MHRVLAIGSSLIALTVALVVIGRVEPSELPTIEQILPAEELEGLSLERRYFGAELDVALVLLYGETDAPGDETIRRVEAVLRDVPGVARTWSSLSFAERARGVLATGDFELDLGRVVSSLREGAPARLADGSSLFAPNERTRLIALRLEKGASSLTRAREITSAIDRALERSTLGGIGAIAIGNAWIRVASWEAAASDLGRMLPWLVAVIVLVPLAVFGSLEAVVLPLFLASLSVALTLSAYRLVVGALDMLVLLLVPLVWSIATLDAVHLEAAARRFGSRNRSLARSGETARARLFSPVAPRTELVGDLARPCFITSLTTFTGLCALAVQDESRLLRSFGIWGAVGTAVAYVLTFWLGPFFIGVLRALRPAPRWSGRSASGLTRVAMRQPIVTGAVWLVLASASAWVLPGIHASSRFPRIFVEEHATESKLERVASVLGAELDPISLIIEGETQGARNPAMLLSAAFAVSSWAQKLPETRFVLPADFVDVEMLRRALEANDAPSADPDRLARGLESIRGRDWVAPWLDLDAGAARIQIFTGKMSEARRAEVFGLLEHFDRTMLSRHRVVPSGPGYYYFLAESRGVEGAIAGAGLSFLAIAVVFALWLRRLTIVSLALLSNLVGFALTLGLLVLADIPWSLALVPVPALLLGIGVDDTVHLLWRTRQDGANGGPNRTGRHIRASRILARARRSGPALIASTLMISGSAAALTFSTLTMNRDFGLVLSFGLLVALAADLTLLPALAASFPLRPRSSRRRGSPQPR